MVTRWRSELFFFLYFKIYLSGAWQMFRPITFQVLPPFFSAPYRDVCQLSQSVVWWHTCVFFFSGFVVCLFFNQRSPRPQPIMDSGLLVLFSSCSSEVYDGLDVCVRVFRLRSHIMNHNAVGFLRQTAADTTSIFHVGQSGCAPLVRLPHQPAVDCACHQEPQIILISCLRCLLLSQISLLSFSRSISIWRMHFVFLAMLGWRRTNIRATFAI